MRIFLIVSLFVTSLSAALQVEVSAPSAILINGRTGKVIYEKNARTKRPPASTTKIATALYVLEQLSSYDTSVTASSSALKVVTEDQKKNSPDLYPSYTLEEDGSMIGIRPGEKMKLKDLLYSLLLSSGNDSANVIAEGYAGSIDDFMKQVNQYLHQTGLKNTHFSNPHGLHSEDHYSTAYDLALLAQKALEHPTFREMVSASQYLVPRTNMAKARELSQSNRLLQKGPFYYPSALGVKTGTTSKAKNCLVAAAEREDRYLISVVLGCERSEDRFLDTIQMFESAFREKKEETTLVPMSRVFEKEIEGGNCLLKARLQEDAVLSQYPSEQVPVKAFIHWESTTAPVDKGQHVASLKIQDVDGNILTSYPLYAEEKVRRSFAYFLKTLFQKGNGTSQHSAPLPAQ